MRLRLPKSINCCKQLVDKWSIFSQIRRIRAKLTPDLGIWGYCQARGLPRKPAGARRYGLAAVRARRKEREKTSSGSGEAGGFAASTMGEWRRL
jgi:hypothetical protein